MAQQVEIAGVLFNDVPYIQCPDGNGVYHQFLDTTIASNAAAAADIAQGKLAYVNGSLVTGTNQGGGGGLEYETGTWTPSEDVATYNISLARTHNEPPCYYLISDVVGTYSTVTNSNFFIGYINSHQMFGELFDVSSSEKRYGLVSYTYRGTSTTTVMNQSASLKKPYTDQSSSSTNDSRYWATESTIRAYCGSTSRYWRSARTYKWIAVWAPTS